jgi:hypothetical protein
MSSIASNPAKNFLSSHPTNLPHELVLALQLGQRISVISIVPFFWYLSSAHAYLSWQSHGNDDNENTSTNNYLWDEEEWEKSRRHGDKKIRNLYYHRGYISYPTSLVVPNLCKFGFLKKSDVIRTLTATTRIWLFFTTMNTISTLYAIKKESPVYGFQLL